MRNGVLGVGCGVTGNPSDWASYEELAISEDGRVHSAARAIYHLPDEALIWTRDGRDGSLYLAKVSGPWRYLQGPDADACDVHNVRPVQIVLVDAGPHVPATIANQFMGEWTIQRIHDPVTARRTATMFAELTRDAEPRSLTLDEVLTEYLDDHDLEHLISVYLQNRHGYFARPLPTRLGSSTYEHVLRDAQARRASHPRATGPPPGGV